MAESRRSIISLSAIAAAAVGVVIVAVVLLVGSGRSDSQKAAALQPRSSAIASPSAPVAAATTAPSTPAATPATTLSSRQRAAAAGDIRNGVQLDDPNPTLAPQPTPKWAQEPPMTTVLTSSLSRVKVYTYNPGQNPSTKSVLITLTNPTGEDLPLTMAGFGQTNGFYLALLDVKPNNTYGWVKASDVNVSTTPYRIEIDQSEHKLALWKNDTVVGVFTVAVGKPSTPTPNGDFFVNTKIKQPYAGGAYGPWIVSSSGFSEVYDTFGDGDAAIGLHGSDEPDSIGHAVSHGCIRMYNSDITLMAKTVPVGTLFEIHA